MDVVTIPRVLVLDEKNKRLLTEECIDVLLTYETELKQIYAIYDYDNKLHKRMVPTFASFASLASFSSYPSPDALMGRDRPSEQEDDHAQHR